MHHLARLQVSHCSLQQSHDVNGPKGCTKDPLVAMLRLVAVLAAVAAASAAPSWVKTSRAPRGAAVDFTVATPSSNTEKLME